MLKKKHKPKLSITKVQKAFNEAIRARDEACTIMHGDCSGNLECSHFYPVGSNGGLRFYPGNAYTQCSSAHFAHHNRNPLLYVRWMQELHSDDLDWMESVRGKSIVRYNQVTLGQIYLMCKSNDIEQLKNFIENINGGR